MLFEYLKEHYDDGEPIFLDDIHIEGRTTSASRLKRLQMWVRLCVMRKGFIIFRKRQDSIQLPVRIPKLLQSINTYLVAVRLTGIIPAVPLQTLLVSPCRFP